MKCPEEKWGNGWFQDWRCNNLEKEINGVKYNRSYLSQRTYHKGELKKRKTTWIL